MSDGLKFNYYNRLPAFQRPFWIKLQNTLLSFYFYANVTYFVYSLEIYLLDINKSTLHTANSIYITYGIWHLISAVLYALSYYNIKKWYEIELLPEYLNIIGFENLVIMPT